jgi:hypothetical protein
VLHSIVRGEDEPWIVCRNPCVSGPAGEFSGVAVIRTQMPGGWRNAAALSHMRQL